MSENTNEVVDGVGDSAVLASIEDGVNKIAKFTTEKAKEAKEGLAALRSELMAKMGTSDEKWERTANDLVDRIDAISKRFSVTGRFNIEQDDLSALKEAVPERFHKNLGAYDGVKYGDKGTFADERYIEAKHAWFNLSSKLQLRNYDGERDKLRAEFNKLNDRFASVAKADMGGLVDTSGGYAVPNIVGNEVLKIMRDASLIYSRARQLPMTSDTLSFPDEATAVTINWSNTDGTTLTAGEPVFGVKTLNARKLIGRATFSLELLDDANVAIIPFLQACFAEKMGGELDFQAMEGTGSPFTGVQTATSVNDAAATNGTNGVVLTYGTGTTTKAGLVKIFTAAGEQVAREDGIFVCPPSVYAAIIGMVDNNNQPVVRLGTVEGQPNNTLFGRPIIVSNRLAKTTIGAGTVSVGSLYYGSPSALLFGTRQGMRWDVSDQVNWAKYQADARMVGRFGFIVGVPTAWVKQTGIIV